MLRTYQIDGRQVTVGWVHRQHPAVYTILVDAVPVTGSVEKSAAGRFLAFDAHRRLLGTFQGLRGAVEGVVREERNARPAR